MMFNKYLSLDGSTTGRTAAPLSRRRFVAINLGGVVGLACMPLASTGLHAQTAPTVAPGQKPTEQPAAFVSIAKDGTVTVRCNRLDMGQGTDTALAMICAEELGAKWSQVTTAFGDQKANYVDPAMGMHLTGGSNSIKNSYTQYRELGARTRAMLLAAAARQWQVPVAGLKAEQGMVTGGGKQASYGQLFEAAMREPVPEQVVLKDPRSFELIGKPTGLKSARAKSSGQQRYGVDTQLPGMVTALIARPPAFGARFKSFDATAAKQVKGVRAVLAVDLDRGAKGIAVVADGYWPAKMGRDALQVVWDTSGVALEDSTALLAQYRTLAGSNTGKLAPGDNFRADISQLAAAPKKLSAEFVFPYLNHAQMEPLACTVDLTPTSCQLHYAAQMPGVDAGAVAQATGLPPAAVQINVLPAGGGFGRRAVATSEYVLEAVAVAQALAKAGQRAPVKVMWSREDDMKAGYYRPMTVHRAEIGFDAQGQVLGWDHRIVSQSIVAGTPFEGFLIKEGVDGTTTEGMREPYNVPMRLAVHHPTVNVPVLWWRAVGSTHTAFVMETLVDEIADATGQDPVAYRLKLMADKHPRHKAALQQAVDQSGYGKKALPTGAQWGVAVHESFESVVAYVVQASVKDGKPVIHSVTAGVHCNLCVNPRTVQAQVQGSAVMALSTALPGHAITLKDGAVQQSNYHQFAPARITDAPQVDVHIVPSNDPPKGMGEPGLPPFAPALANAMRRVTGKAQRALPLVLV
jgi:isoquinoline 1-oxidoreductase subunit beta